MCYGHWIFMLYNLLWDPNIVSKSIWYYLFRVIFSVQEQQWFSSISSGVEKAERKKKKKRKTKEINEMWLVMRWIRNGRRAYKSEIKYHNTKSQQLNRWFLWLDRLIIYWTNLYKLVWSNEKCLLNKLFLLAYNFFLYVILSNVWIYNSNFLHFLSFLTLLYFTIFNYPIFFF